MDMHVMQNTMYESSNDVDRQAVYVLDPPITIPASLTMTTFAALHTKNINIPKRNCVGGAPVRIKFLKCEVCKRSYSSKSSFSNHLERSTLCFRNKKRVIPASLNCPVKINVCEEKGLASATYYPIHNHHTGFHNTKYQRFKDSTRNLIKSYLLLSFLLYKYKNLIRSNVRFRGHRTFVPSKEAFISRRSIRTYYRRLQNSVRPENDALSVMCNVERLKAEEYNPILLFKPQNSKTLYGPPGLDALLNSDKSFALGIQTETQKEMLIKHSYKIIGIDSTHGTNHYGFYLLSIHIQDEYGQGYPVAHFICNYLDYDTLVTLFNSLKCRISNLSVYNVMTDDDNVLYLILFLA
ncbi:c2H2-type domain-containing protein [Caerostris extrusa]|uniref:C2H2-type domain-containing protein n=1 Tax=Caerostris extrusa TaxID=172846 RepID=A0AAV4P371_CAEEX|nr:c2H2-type domain-containing protein [Caerostris extrusa]